MLCALTHYLCQHCLFYFVFDCVCLSLVLSACSRLSWPVRCPCSLKTAVGGRRSWLQHGTDGYMVRMATRHGACRGRRARRWRRALRLVGAAVSAGSADGAASGLFPPSSGGVGGHGGCSSECNGPRELSATRGCSGHSARATRGEPALAGWWCWYTVSVTDATRYIVL